MTRPDFLPRTDVPESTVSDLHALYHEAAGAEPSPMLDRSILDAARVELRADAATKSRRHPPWWKGWLTVTSTIAVAVLGLSLTWRVMDEQERHLRDEVRNANSILEGADKAADNAVPAQRPTEASPSINTPAPAAAKSHRVESQAAHDSPAAMQEQAAKPTPAAEPRPFLAPQETARMEAAAGGALSRSTPASPAPPAPAVGAMKSSKHGEVDELRERRDASSAFDTGSGLARPQGKVEAKRLGAGSSGEKKADSENQPSASAAGNFAARLADDAATPEAWLKHIRELRAAGRSAEAAQSLARFRARYPDLVTPEDLIDLK